MLRPLAAALAALMFFAPLAEAGKVLVVGTRAVNADVRQEWMALGVLQTLGVDYDFIRAGSPEAKTEYCRLGVVTEGGTGGTRTKTYVGVIHLGYYNFANNSSPGYRPESLQVAARWPLVPQIFLGPMGMPGTTWTDDAAPCSTGIRSNSAPGANLNESYRHYLVGQPEVWAPTGMRPVFADQSGAGAAWYARGIWRPIVGTGAAYSVSAREAVPANRCSDCDRLAARSTSPDSVALWARYLSASAADRARVLIFCEWGQFPQLADPTLFGFAASMMDSATGWQVIKKKVKVSYTMDGTGRTGSYGNPAQISLPTSDTLATGIFCAADSCDSTNAFATSDSLNSLRTWDGRRVPITFSFEADSMAYPSMGYHRRLIRRVDEHRVAISSFSGTVANQPGIRNAGQYSLYDIFGHTRRREILPVGTTSLPATCAVDDTSSYCMLKRAQARAESLFAGRVSGVLLPSQGDFTPTTVSRANSMALDTLTWAFTSLGIRGSVVSVMSKQNTIGNTTIAGGPIGWSVKDNFLVARNPTTGTRTGTFRLLPTRGSDLYRTIQVWWQGNPSTHDVYQEEAMGLWTGDWYPAHDDFHANHLFETRTRVIRMAGVTFGGSGQGTHAPRSAWWHIKGWQNRINAFNKLNGRTVMEAVTLDELAADR